MLQKNGTVKLDGTEKLGTSMGGMIAQNLAIDFPEKVWKLVLTVTCPRPTPILEASMGEWVECTKMRRPHRTDGQQRTTDLLRSLMP